MNRAADFQKYRELYPEFHYHGYRVTETDQAIVLSYDFEIPGLAEFHPELQILKKTLPLKSIADPVVQNLAFQIGLVELISYWKAACPPRVIVHCGLLAAEQIAWWKKIYYYGLGELFYTNGISTTLADFLTLASAPSAPVFDYPAASTASEGYIVLVGGGKDSNVTLEVLDTDPERDYCLIVNPKPVTRECAALAGFDDARVIEVQRRIDPKLLELNQQGFINGHTPFSSMLAFVSYLAAYLTGRKYVVVSNESSANESNVCSADDAHGVNHQYSKSFEFEEDFRAYAAKYLKAPVEYFSFLRPLNELQIAKIFARLEKYHPVFKSCNVGSKGSEWVWCGHCAKCLFAYIILSPYLYPKKLVAIFGHDLFADASLVTTLQELTGHGANKPFDCVGTFAEVNFALSKTIQQLQAAGQPLPYLLQYYLEHYGLADLHDDLEHHYNTANNLTAAQDALLRAEIFQDVE